MNYWGYGYNHMGYWDIGDVIGIIFAILIIILVIGLIKRMVWGGRMHRHCRLWEMSGENKTAIDILKERYAKGEIKKEEFEQMKKDIES